MTAYSASKFAVRGLTQATGMKPVTAIQSVVLNVVLSLHFLSAQELRPHKITVNSYAPGLVATPMGQRYHLFHSHPLLTGSELTVAHPDDDKHGGIGSMAKLVSCIIFTNAHNHLIPLEGCWSSQH